MMCPGVLSPSLGLPGWLAGCGARLESLVARASIVAVQEETQGQI